MIILFPIIIVRHCQEIEVEDPYVFHPCHAIRCTRITECGASQCNSTCADYLNPQKDCDCEVTWGCRCEGNQYLNSDGTCVDPEKCTAN